LLQRFYWHHVPTPEYCYVTDLSAVSVAISRVLLLKFRST
jgi:hypothetical protein